MAKNTNIIKHQPVAIDLNDMLRKTFEDQKSNDQCFEEWLSDVTKEESPNTVFTLEFQENDEGETCIKIPDDLIKLLGWKLDDDIVFEEIDNTGEFTLQNISKQFRDATQAWKDATSIDME